MIQPLIDAVLAVLAGIPGVETVDEFPDRIRKVRAPAVLVMVEEIGPAERPGNGQMSVELRLAALIYVSRTDRAADSIARDLSLAVQHAIFTAGNHGVRGVGQPHLREAEPAPFALVNERNTADGYAVWAARWSQDLAVGADIWTDPGLPPTDLWVGEMGQAHELTVTGDPDA